MIIANRGLVFADRRAGALVFSLRCAEGFGASVAGVPGVFFDPTGSLLLSVYSGVAASSDRACTSQPSAGLAASSLSAAVQDVASPARLYVTSRTLDTRAGVFVSEDYGRTWSARFTNRVDDYYDTLLVSPSDARRLYASGRRIDRARGGSLYLSSRSLDLGESWQDTPFASELVLFAVHPRLADVVFAYQASDALETRFTILRSGDGGVSFEPVLEAAAQPAALTASSASTLWLGLSGPAGQGGLYRSSDDGRHFERVHAETIEQASCLQQRGERLWLCATMAPNTAGVWFSRDEGASFEPFMIFADVTEPVPCDGEAQALCARAWLDFDGELHPGSTLATVAPSAGAADVPALPSAGAAAAGGGCRALAGPTGRLSQLGSAGWLCIAWLAARRRRRATRACSDLACD